MIAPYLDVIDGKLTSTDHENKNVKLGLIFERFTSQLNHCFSEIDPNKENFDGCIQKLNLLKINSKTRYKDFNSKPRSYKLIFLEKVLSSLPKSIANYILNRFPFNIFNNHVLNSQLVKTEYTNCKTIIKEKINHLNILKKKQIEETDRLNKINSELKELEDLCIGINDILNLQNGMNYHFKKFTNDLGKLKSKIIPLDYQKNGSKKELLLSYRLPESLVDEIFPDPVKEPKKPVMDELRNSIGYLTGGNFTNERFKLFGDPISCDLNFRGYLEISKNNVKQRGEKCLDAYEGVIKIRLKAMDGLKNLQEIMKEIRKHPTCKPCRLIIEFDEGAQLDGALIKELQKLASLAPHILLEKLDQLDWNKYSPQEQADLLTLFPYTDWIPANPPRIILPANLAEWEDERIIDFALFFHTTDLDLSHIPATELKRVLRFFPDMKAVTINQSTLSDAQVADFIDQGYFKNLIKLDLEGCDHLTTDILPHLIKIETLVQLKASALNLGKNQLPQLDDPFKVKTFYTSVKAIRSFANQLYTGPLQLASLFQIPLARHSTEFTFNEKQTYLDPRCVSQWLYKNDYLHLEAQPSIKSILADETPYLNDDNLCSFVQKFPELEELSLYGCSSITDRGIMELLATAPRLKKLDVTDCEGITLNSFKELALLQNLEEISVSGGTDPKEIEKLPGALQSKIKIKPTFLKISDEELKTGLSLKAVLNDHLPLNQLSRLDLSNCKSLKFQDFQYLIECLNSEIVKIEGGYQKTNFSKLNITSLDLTGSGFDPHWIIVITEANKNLNHLQQLIVGNLKDKQLDNLKKLETWYPHIHFQEKYSPIVERFNLDKALSSYEGFLFSEGKKGEGVPQEQLFNRILIELFGEEVADQKLIEKVLSQPVKIMEESGPVVTFDDWSQTNFSLPQDQLYLQSRYIRESLRKGGNCYKSTVSLQNQNCTAAAGTILTDLLKKNLLPNGIRLKETIEAAEIVNSETLNIPHFYKKLLLSIYAQIRSLHFDFLQTPRGFKLFEKLVALRDEKALILFELRLISMLNANIDLTDEAKAITPNLPHVNIVFSLITHRQSILQEINFEINAGIEIQEGQLDFFRALLEPEGIDLLIQQLSQLSPDVQINIAHRLIENLVQSLENQALGA